MKSTKGIALFVYAIGVLLFGPVWTMTMFPEKLGASYVFGVIDALLVVSAILILYIEYSNISQPSVEVG
jgi:hypothetical protein